DAIADLSVSMYVSGLSAARMDAALTDEQPSINDDDRRGVLAESSLAVLLEERAAYRQRVDEAAARVAAATEEIDGVTQGLQAAVEARPAAVSDEAATGTTVAAERVAYEEARALATVEGVDFTLVALDAYRQAAVSMAFEQPACGVQWWAVAGISRVEGHHGTYGGSTVALGGDTTKRIIGIQLNGTNQTAVIGDSDGGALDGDPVFDRAVGPMQFIPQTWTRFAADGNGDGVASPFNLYDATLAAARYLCTSSHGLADDPGLRSAYFSYNHSEHYVSSVLGHARAYQRAVQLAAR
ncbi:MAG TPA: lytic transglycosylase domain-containing protein, partial [Acidimicrobiales bacterium]